MLRYKSVVFDLFECADRNARSVQNQFGLTSEQDVSGCPPMVSSAHRRGTHSNIFEVDLSRLFVAWSVCNRSVTVSRVPVNKRSTWAPTFPSGQIGGHERTRSLIWQSAAQLVEDALSKRRPDHPLLPFLIFCWRRIFPREKATQEKTDRKLLRSGARLDMMALWQ